MKSTFYLIVAFLTLTAKAQQKPVKATPIQLIYEGQRSVPKNSKIEIYKSLLKAEEKGRRGESFEIIQSDTSKGVLMTKRTFICSFKADTSFDGRTIKEAVMKKVTSTFTVLYKIGDNFFTYRIDGFTNEKGEQILQSDLKQPKLSACATSELQAYKDRILFTSIFMTSK